MRMPKRLSRSSSWGLGRILPARSHLVQSASVSKSLVSLLEERDVRPRSLLPWEVKRGVMHTLEGEPECWPIRFLQNVSPNLDDEVGTDADHIAVEGTVVDRAHGDSVRHDWVSSLGVLFDVSSVEQFLMTKLAHCASGLICHKHPAPEHWLVESSPDGCHRVLPARRKVHGVRQKGRVELVPCQCIEGKNELTIRGLFAHKPNRIDRHEPARGHPNEPSQGLSVLHRSSERFVIESLRIRSLPLVAVVAVRSDLVRVRQIGRALPKCGSDRQCRWETRNNSDTTHVLE